MKWSDIEKEFNTIDMRCTELAERKNHDYGNAWESYRKTTMMDLILGHAKRMVNLSILGEEKALVPDKINDELLDIINWCRFILIKMELGME